MDRLRKATAWRPKFLFRRIIMEKAVSEKERGEALSLSHHQIFLLSFSSPSCSHRLAFTAFQTHHKTFSNVNHGALSKI